MLDAAVINAAAQGRLDELKHLLGQGGNRHARDPIRTWTPLWWAHANAHYECVQLLRLPLVMFAIEVGSVEILQGFKERGYDFNQIVGCASGAGVSLLGRASMRGFVDCVRVILSAGAPPWP
jgi:hypothetical protein